MTRVIAAAMIKATTTEPVASSRPCIVAAALTTRGHGSQRDNDGQIGADRGTPRMLGLRGDAFTGVFVEAVRAVDQITF